ncbi:response regulator [Paenibacillus sp. sgz500958]|uniref:response regulator n=1 Tax=Paenibacillus sp. sgz500958 TaxID=3242475 RepID=UPI0036D32130
MIRAVVVDDERLVRKGFISMIDWSAFGVVIVGEAGDGKSALELLRQQEVDLLFVDITMPGMSGFDLIRAVRQRYSGIRSVVLTCHHEFDFVQEALRLGAVDYIVKTLLEMENADEVIGRLVERIKWEDSTREALIRGEGKRMAADKVLVYLPLGSGGSEKELFQLAMVRNNPLITFQEMWVTPLLERTPEVEMNREIITHLGSRWKTALVCGLREQPLKEIEAIFTDKLQNTLFYNSGTGELIPLKYEELKETAVVRGSSEVLTKAKDLRWSLDGMEWECLLREITLQKPDYDHFPVFGESLCRQWGYLLFKPEEALEMQEEITRMVTWCHWKQWLRRFADIVQRRMIELGLTKEVMSCLFRAIIYMREHAGDKINQSEVASAVNMSRGYFSQCFAKLAGESFGESLRGMRLDLAQSLLLTTSVSICEIASRSGFEDDRYFSRLFRERIGMLPSEFRAEGVGRT